MQTALGPEETYHLVIEMAWYGHPKTCKCRSIVDHFIWLSAWPWTIFEHFCVGFSSKFGARRVRGLDSTAHTSHHLNFLLAIMLKIESSQRVWFGPWWRSYSVHKTFGEKQIRNGQDTTMNKIRPNRKKNSSIIIREKMHISSGVVRRISNVFFPLHFLRSVRWKNLYGAEGIPSKKNNGAEEKKPFPLEVYKSDGMVHAICDDDGVIL